MFCLLKISAAEDLANELGYKLKACPDNCCLLSATPRPAVVSNGEEKLFVECEGFFEVTEVPSFGPKIRQDRTNSLFNWSKKMFDALIRNFEF